MSSTAKLHSACDVCKRRKVRCAGGNPCPNCIRHQVSCQYTRPSNRLAQFQRRAAQLQERIQNIERVWKHHLPNVDLDAALAADQPEPPQTSSPDSEYEEAETLNWDESHATPATDGIGSLSMKWKGIGYMGPQTGNALLRKLQSLAVLHLGSEEVVAQDTPSQDVSEDLLHSRKNEYLDAYFKNFHPLYPMLHEGYFRAQDMGVIARPRDGSWEILYNIVLALGAFCKPSSEADIGLARKAYEHISWDELQKGTLAFVQAFTLLAIYLQKRNRPNSSFTFLGIAANMAQGIGLHREFSGTSVSVFQMEIRRRVWWTFFIFDSEFRLTFGRPTLHLGGTNTKLPLNLHDGDLVVDLDSAPQPSREATVTTSLIWQAKLAKIGNSANERLVAKHIPPESYMSKLGQDVFTWTAALPEYVQADYEEPSLNAFKKARMLLSWRSMHLRINIYRPFLLALIRDRLPLELDDMSSPAYCFRSAETCIVSILAYLDNHDLDDRFFLWYASYWLITAVFVHITCLLYDQYHPLASNWRIHIQNVKNMLERVGTIESTAARAAKILDKVMNLAPMTPDASMDIFNEPMRMEVAELWNRSWPDTTVPQEISPSTWDLEAGFSGFEHLLN